MKTGVELGGESCYWLLLGGRRDVRMLRRFGNAVL